MTLATGYSIIRALSADDPVMDVRLKICQARSILADRAECLHVYVWVGTCILMRLLCKFAYVHVKVWNIFVECCSAVVYFIRLKISQYGEPYLSLLLINLCPMFGVGRKSTSFGYTFHFFISHK